MKNSRSTSLNLCLFFMAWFGLPVLNATAQTTNHTCGAPDMHNESLTYGQVSDIDGNSYKTIIIDDLIWFAENLKVTRFQNGDAIPNVTDSAAWASLSGPGRCSYQNDSSFDCPKGKLYNFYVAKDVRNPCPAGWRVPKKEDFDKLINFYDPDANGGAPSNLPNSAGGYLKNKSFTYWLSPNPNASNLSGFSAIPNGGRNNEGKFSFSHNQASSYWYATELGTGGMGFFLEMAYTQDYAVRNAYWGGYGICIRCVTDASTLNLEGITAPHFGLYPNPADALVELQVTGDMLGKDYHIFDVTGRLVLQGTLVSSNTMLSISDLQPGVYVVRVASAHAQVLKLIKQ